MSDVNTFDGILNPPIDETGEGKALAPAKTAETDAQLNAKQKKELAKAAAKAVEHRNYPLMIPSSMASQLGSPYVFSINGIVHSVIPDGKSRDVPQEVYFHMQKVFSGLGKQVEIPSI